MLFEEVVIAAFYAFDPATGEYTLVRQAMPPNFAACVDLAWELARTGGDLVVQCIYHVGKAGDPA